MNLCSNILQNLSKECQEADGQEKPGPGSSKLPGTHSGGFDHDFC